MVVMVIYGCYGDTWLLWIYMVVMVIYGCYGDIWLLMNNGRTTVNLFSVGRLLVFLVVQVGALRCGKISLTYFSCFL